MADSNDETTARGNTSATSELRKGHGTTSERVLHDLRRQLAATTTITTGEHTALLPRAHFPADTISPGRSYLASPVSRRKADLVLLFSYTGNTVYVGLGIADPAASTRWIKSLISITGFCAGSFCFSRFHALFGGPSRRVRGVLVARVLVQFLCIVAAAVIVTVAPDTEPGNGHHLHWHVLVPLAVVSFQSSGQAVISRALRYRSLTSVVLTSIYCDLFSDASIFAANNADRNRRAAAPVLLLVGALVGALVGGFWSRSEISMMGALWTAAALKLCIVVLWLVWKAEDTEGDSDP
ncbi:Uu.00g135360.m01.CDS01 [Anthostomella pinea]|uniref:Uu.00g135360.m01.CDS01 n=1 Tax=Anthostomella pinea TaxID=933095 RepID=A0AAI8VP70_9PEZI|nr:Uu.00g135360.m01.CDS01 [Anthostomella pinea]